MILKKYFKVVCRSFLLLEISQEEEEEKLRSLFISVFVAVVGKTLTSREHRVGPC